MNQIAVYCVCVCLCGAAAAAHSLRAVDLGVGDGADKRHNLAVVEEETHEGDRRFLFLSTHLAQDVGCRCRHGLSRGGTGGGTR